MHDVLRDEFTRRQQERIRLADRQVHVAQIQVATLARLEATSRHSAIS